MDNAPWLTADQQRVWRSLLKVHANLLARLDEELQTAHGMNLADYEVLVHLSEAADRRLRMAELAQLLLISPSGLTRRVATLEKSGLVRREKCADDGRGAYAVLTDKGLDKLIEAAPSHVRGVQRYLLSSLKEDSLPGLLSVLQSIEDELSSGTIPPRSFSEEM